MSGTTEISAHRGGTEFAPAGSHEAYGSALEAGAEYVEFDVRPPSVHIPSSLPIRAARRRAGDRLPDT